MSLPRIVVDNSAVIPAFLPEERNDHYDAGLVTNRSRRLVQAIRTRRVNAYVPPSFFREFLHVAVTRAPQAGLRVAGSLERVRAHWEDLLTLDLIPVQLKNIIRRTGPLTFDDFCPPADSWYVAAAIDANATFWMSHKHNDDLFAVASKYVPVRLLSTTSPEY